MDLLPSQDQLDIVATAADVLANELPIGEILRRRREGSAFSEDAWRRCADTGLLGIGLPDSIGGAGCGVPEEALLFREVGRHLAPGPFLSTVLAAHLAVAVGDMELAAGFVAGDIKAGWADPLVPVPASEPALDGEVQVRDWAGAQWMLVVTEGGAGLVETRALGPVIALRSIDAGVRLGNANARALPFARWLAGTDGSLYQTGLVLVAAQLVGIAEACRDSSVHHAKTREQFGRPIGVNQAIKHGCADMAVAAARASAQLLFAAAACESDSPDAILHAHIAKFVAGEAARENAAHNIQIHGGMGFTTEFAAHLFVERAEVLEQTLAGRAESLSAIISLPAPQ
jgi:alkylation response protein AidB-like acyl-CoA dehydrogenase